jgi:hypothetical protein
VNNGECSIENVYIKGNIEEGRSSGYYDSKRDTIYNDSVNYDNDMIHNNSMICDAMSRDIASPTTNNVIYNTMGEVLTAAGQAPLSALVVPGQETAEDEASANSFENDEVDVTVEKMSPISGDKTKRGKEKNRRSDTLLPSLDLRENAGIES